MCKSRSTICIAAVTAVAAFITAISAAAQTNDREALLDRIDWLLSTHEATIDGVPIAAVNLVDELYLRRDYVPAWSDPALVRQLYDQVLKSVEHGLDPDDYHARQIAARLQSRSGAADPAYRADTEILCTDALARLAVSLHFGKLDPGDLDPAWNFSREIERQDPVARVNQELESKTIGRTLEALAPQNPYYLQFKDALKKYRSIQAAGGWQPVSSGPVLKLGDSGLRVVELRRRLAASGDLAPGQSTASDIFDEELEKAVKHFQIRHGIDTDGKVGPRSIEELGVPVKARINQIRASLERNRWVFRDLPREYLVVNIAGFRAYLVRDREVVWSTRVQVGKPYHATPVFKDTMRYLDFNPTWTIPPGILRNETLPRVRRDPDYLSRNNMSVVTTSGKIVDPSTIDWAATATKGFPYMIRQEPGPNNALGRVKFMFPNKYMVYLHDTPSKGLFARSERAFSHGCIRTQNPFDLAELLLADQGWDRARIDRVVASKKNTRVNLERPIAVLLLYWTAEADEDGTVHFRGDVYNRDARIIKGLDEPFRVDRPAGIEKAVRWR